MRPKASVVALVAASAIAATAVGGSTRPARATSLGSGGITVSVPLPAVQQSSATTLTFSVTAPAGKTAGPLHVQTVNDAKLGNLAVVYVAETPKKASAHESATLSVFVKRFLSRTMASKTDEPTVTIHVSVVAGKYESNLTLTKKSGDTCDNLKWFDGAFEHGKTVASTARSDSTLVSGRSANAQPSPPEEVLDNILAGVQAPVECDFKPEGDDPGNT